MSYRFSSNFNGVTSKPNLAGLALGPASKRRQRGARGGQRGLGGRGGQGGRDPQRSATVAPRAALVGDRRTCGHVLGLLGYFCFVIVLS